VPPGLDIAILDGGIDQAKRCQTALLAGFHRFLEVVVDLLAQGRHGGFAPEKGVWMLTGARAGLS
jgi:hypothetical protein